MYTLSIFSDDLFLLFTSHSGGSFYLVIKWSILATVFIGLTLYILHTLRGYIKSLYSTAPVSPVIDVAG